MRGAARSLGRSPLRVPSLPSQWGGEDQVDAKGPYISDLSGHRPSISPGVYLVVYRGPQGETTSLPEKS